MPLTQQECSKEKTMICSTHKNTYPITSNMSGFNHSCRPSAILDLFQSVAGEHAELLGLGFDPLKERGYSFVLARIKYDLYKPLKRFDKVVVKTWPQVAGRIELDRDFEIYLDNELVGIGTSKWVLMDISTRRIARASVISYPCEIDPKVNYSEFDKLIFTDITFDSSYIYEVRHNDIDLIGHMNNTKYVDCLDIDLNKDVTHVEVNFLNETKLGDLIKINKSCNNNTIIYEGVCNDRVSFRAKIIYFEEK